MPGYDSLYGGKPPFEQGSDTSENAAEQIADEALNIRERVYQFIKGMAVFGATCWEVEEGLDLSHQTASARIRELVLKGRVMDGGNRRQTASRRPAVVWVIASLPGFIPGPHKPLRQRLLEAEVRIRELEKENTRLKMRLLGKKRQGELF